LPRLQVSEGGRKPGEMMIARGCLLRSKAESLVKHVASGGSWHGLHSFSEASARGFSSEPSLQADSTEEIGFKGHGMLAPFTAGWQSTDVHPLVIDRSEVLGLNAHLSINCSDFNLKVLSYTLQLILQGAYVYDINGKKYIDALAGLWCTALGGSEPRLVKAATEQLNKLPFYHSFWNRTTKPSLDLANDVLNMFTAREMGKVFFANSGSEANDSQVKLVWYYNNAMGRPDKKKFIARSKSYHGSTLISASLSGLPALHQKFDLPAPFVLHTDCPHYWRFHLPDETEEEFSTRLANNLE
uniref:Uncharacterized protein n=1 Tax=Aegilops tauschii subsp. strangulata TaxID=200361 RepID=A0A453S8D4_AEGTS